MDNLKILIDNRERKVFDAISYNYEFKNKIINYEIKNLYYGDYNILYDNNVIAVFERKTWTDLAATIKDKHRSANIEKLLHCRDETNCHLYYIIEGPMRFADNRKIGGIEFNKLEMKLISLMVNNNIFVVQSTNEQHTINRIIKFAKYYVKKNKLGSNELPSPPEETPEIINRRIWNNLRGLGKDNMEIVSSHFTISDLIDGNITKEELQTLNIPKIAINKFMKYTLENKSERILTGILRVSPAIARALLKEKTIKEIKSSSIEDLMNIQLGDVKSRKIGKKLSSRIIEILNYKFSKPDIEPPVNSDNNIDNSLDNQS